MAPNNPTKELIDERIVRLLGLSYEFELDYQTYSFYLKEKLVEVTSSRKKIPPEEFDLIKNEFKRVRGKTGRFTFKIKKNRINANNVSNLNNFSKKNKILLPGTQVSKEQAKQSVVGEGILDIVKSIGKTVISIHKTLLSQSNLSKKEFESDRKNKEQLRRGSKEDKLEERENGVIETAKKILAPFQSIFDRIIRFLVFTILGRAFKVFMDWAGDPKNKGKLTTIGKFLKDWWPALLGAWFLFATPLGAFTRTIIGTIAKLSFHLAKFAIPKLVQFAATNPVITAGAVTGVAAGAGFMMEKNRTDEITKRQGTTPEKRGQGNWFNEIGKAFNPGQLGMGGVSPMVMSRGGSVFSGVVDKDTGETVSGAGPDTQFLPIENGGGAVLQRGEVVLQKGARERMIRQAGVDPLAYNIGSNANKPRKINANTLASSGGLIGLSNGGEIGIAAHHLKQDEALSSLTPGINDFTRPGSSKWSKLTTNTPIHSYIDSVGKPTIGWGSTYYDSILNGKKPVKSGDKITKGKADNILATNISGLSKEYSTKIPHWSKMTNNQRAGLLVLGYNAPYGPIGAYPKLTKALQKGDIKSASQNIHREGPNAERIALEKSLLMSGPTNLKNLVGPKIMGEKKIGSGIPGIPPFLYKGKKDGGLLGSSDGTKNPHSASDPRFGAFDPNEYLISKSGVRNAGGGSFERGAQFFDNLLAILDKNSNPAKQGKYNIEPPSRRNSVVTLPTISNTIGGNMGGNVNATKDRVVPGFSAISSVAQETRFRNAEIYGIG